LRSRGTTRERRLPCWGSPITSFRGMLRKYKARMSQKSVFTPAKVLTNGLVLLNFNAEVLWPVFPFSEACLGGNAMPKDYYIVLWGQQGCRSKKKSRRPTESSRRSTSRCVNLGESHEKFLELQRGLRNPCGRRKRRKYDEELARQGRALKIPESPKRSPHDNVPLSEKWRERILLWMSFFSGFCPGFSKRGKAATGKDLVLEVILSQEEAARGGLFPITVPVLEPCPSLPAKGLWEEFFCPLCYGRGVVRAEREFSLSIPPRVTHATQIKPFHRGHWS